MVVDLSEAIHMCFEGLLVFFRTEITFFHETASDKLQPVGHCSPGVSSLNIMWIVGSEHEKHACLNGFNCFLSVMIGDFCLDSNPVL